MKLRKSFASARLALTITFGISAANVATAQEPRPVRVESTKPAAKSDAETLAEAWPDRPEWLDMYTDILQGSQLGARDGWFRRAVPQIRYNWEATKKAYDRDGNGTVAASEFPGSEADFARLDRNGDHGLTAADFDFNTPQSSAQPGTQVFLRMDRDANGKVSREEFQAFFDQLGGGSEGFLSLSEVQDILKPAPQMPSRPTAGIIGQPSKEVLVKALFKQELGSLQPGPRLGEQFRDFTLKTFEGDREITLSKLVGPKPVVLVFGNFTCGPFRAQAGNIEKLYHRYKDRATFVMVYVREAHPTDGWRMDSNERVGVVLPQPTTYEERVAVAKRCDKQMNLGFPLLVDTMDDAVGGFYSGMPSRLYLIDREGKIAFKNGRGPFGFKPAELEQSLILLLQDTASQSKNATSAAR